MGIDDDDASGESEDEWQKLLGGGNKDDASVAEAEKPVKDAKPLNGDSPTVPAPVAQTGLAAARAADRSENATRDSSADAKPANGSGLARMGNAHVSRTPSPLEEEWRKLLDVQWDKVDNLEPEDNPEEDEGDSTVVALRWLDEEEEKPSSPLGKKLTPTAKAAVKPRPTAVKSMPFKPPDFLPTDIILKPSPRPSATPKMPAPAASPKMPAPAAPQKRSAPGVPDLRSAGPPAKAARVEISKPGDLLRHMTGSLKKLAKNGDKPHTSDLSLSKEPKKDAAAALLDKDGRPYNWETVVVNFAGVGATFVRTARARYPKKNYRVFDWEGVRLCVRHLKFRLGLKVIGVTSEELLGPDKGSAKRLSLPGDIRLMCQFVEVADTFIEPHPRRAGSIATLSAAWQRNCRFISDDISDALQASCESGCRTWLRGARRMLLMRFFFDPRDGHFETPDGGMSARA